MSVQYYVQAYFKWLFGVFFGAIILIVVNWTLTDNMEGIVLAIILFALVGLLYPFLQLYMEKRKSQKDG
ncbi:hypothetical protein [Natribacillus halophilus]|uniref:Uncharacterized protein n=1 Tax=Natribacillus halophilus TaxID=549003 RepID=A0A1G8MKR5_9BACI|nr:hypothetical protein [Natribacillus halophilus]SDI68425.1 hypothetical protein SAMN04488123_104215 [Natribacillus halophilus]